MYLPKLAVSQACCDPCGLKRAPEVLAAAAAAVAGAAAAASAAAAAAAAVAAASGCGTTGLLQDGLAGIATERVYSQIFVAG